MRHYSIFLIQEDVAEEYFGKESLLYGLFYEYAKRNNENQNIVEKQVEYITRKVPYLHIQQLILKNLKSKYGFKVTRDSYKIVNSSSEGKSTACLSIHNRYLSLVAKGNYDAETTFFEVLRKYDSCFLAMEFNLDRYGWLNPIKQRKFV